MLIGMIIFRIDSSSNVPGFSQHYANNIVGVDQVNNERRIENESDFDDEANPQSCSPDLPLRLISRPFGTTPYMCKIVIIRGLIGGIGFINYYYTLSNLPLGDAAALSSLYPIITIFLARVVLGEAIIPSNIVAALFSITGAMLISHPSFLFGSEEDVSLQRPPTLGYITALMGSFCQSGVIILIKKAGKLGAHTLQLLFSWVVFGISLSMLVGFIAAIADGNQSWRMPSREEVPSVLGVCISGTFGHFLLNYAGKLLPAALTGLLRSSDIFWAYLLQIVVLYEQPSKETLWGVILVCLGLGIALLVPNNGTIIRPTLVPTIEIESVGNEEASDEATTSTTNEIA